MAPTATEGRVATPEWRWGCRRGTPVGCSHMVVFSSTTVTYNAGLEPVTTGMRRDQKAHKHVNVNCPASSHSEGIQRTHGRSRFVWHANRLSQSWPQIYQMVQTYIFLGTECCHHQWLRYHRRCQ